MEMKSNIEAHTNAHLFSHTNTSTSRAISLHDQILLSFSTLRLLHSSYHLVLSLTTLFMCRFISLPFPSFPISFHLCLIYDTKISSSNCFLLNLYIYLCVDIIIFLIFCQYTVHTLSSHSGITQYNLI